MPNQCLAVALCAIALTPETAVTQTPRPLLPIAFENSAEFDWLGKTGAAGVLRRAAGCRHRARW